ncbi:MAG: SOS response-associated peptidase family protein [Microbacterium sp.]
MCASYGIDPRFIDDELFADSDERLREGLRFWAERNAGETLRPTGRRLRNLNPLVTSGSEGPALEHAWWGHLANGAPVSYPSINTRSERLRERPEGLRGRAIAPATGWFELQKPYRAWHELGIGDGVLFGMAAVTRPGRDSAGHWHTCYSVVMRPAPAHVAHVHDRVPLLIPAAFAADWLTATASRGILEEALLSAASLDERIRATPRATDDHAAPPDDMLF